MKTSAACKRRAAALVLGVFLLAFSGCAPSSPMPLAPAASWTAGPASATASPTPTPTPSPTPVPTPDPVERALAAMTTRQKAAQLLLCGFYSEEEGLTLAGEQQVGGLILYERNITTVEEVSALSRRLLDAGTIPPLLGTDQEGGRVSRLPEGMTPLESAREVGDLNDTAYALDFGVRTARVLREMGLNTDFAPVLDIDSNPANPVIGMRAFGTTAERVSRIAPQVAAGLTQGGVIPVGKHFPGHGDTTEDSHTTLPRLDISPDALRQRELVPFQAAIDDGIPVIMVAHIVFSALDDHPASLSPVILKDLLRREMGFAGVIMTDDICMQAIAATLTPAQATVAAVTAGCDMVIIGHKPDAVEETLTALCAAVEDGRLSPDELDAKVTRILRLKQAYGLLG